MTELRNTEIESLIKMVKHFNDKAESTNKITELELIIITTYYSKLQTKLERMLTK